VREEIQDCRSYDGVPYPITTPGAGCDIVRPTRKVL
jgi:hypothetical protein